MFNFVIALITFAFVVPSGLKAIFYGGFTQRVAQDAPGNYKRRRPRRRHRYVPRRHTQFR
jgi:hypothetical protein